MDNLYELRLNWIGGDGVTEYEMKFIYNIGDHLKIEFAKAPKNPVTGKADWANTEKEMIPVQYKNNVKNENIIGMFILFIDGNIVILNDHNEEVATIKVPDFMITYKDDVNDRKYGTITGEKTRIRFASYGECYFLISPVLFENWGILESAELKNGEVLGVISTELRSIIPKPLGPGNINIITETGPDTSKMDPSDVEAMDIVKESWFKFTVHMEGDLGNPDVDHKFLMSNTTPVLYNLSLVSDAVKLPRDKDKIPGADEAKVNLDGANFGKSVDESGEYTCNQLELSYDLYQGTNVPLDLNVPFLFKVSADDVQKNDYSEEYKYLTDGVQYVNIEETVMGLFLVNQLGYTRTNANVFEKKLSVACIDIIKKLAMTFLPNKVTYVGKKNVDAISDLVNMAHIGERLYVPAESLIKSAEGFSLPAFPDGGRQWVFDIGTSVWECIQRIRSFYGWILYINNDGMIVYRYYDRSSLNHQEMIDNAKYIFVPNYNWTETGVIGLQKDIIPISEYSKVDVDSYRTRIQVIGINGTPNQKLYDSVLGKEVIAQVGDKISCVVINKELEEKLGETRMGAFEDLTLTTIKSIRQTAKCIARQMFRKRTTVAFKVLTGELILGLDLYDPILLYEDGQQILYEVVSLAYYIRPNSIEVDIEARDVP
jgi:hypothetical protein